MIGPRKRTAPIRLSGVIVEPKDIVGLADIVWKQYQRDLEKMNRGERKEESFVWFTLTRSDGRTYEGPSMKVACEGQVLETKKITEFEIAYEDREEKKSIVVDLRHGAISRAWNLATVSGFNEEWVEAKTAEITDLVNGWRKQPKWVHGKRLLALSAIPFVGFALVCADVLGFLLHVTPSTEWAAYFVSFVFAGLPTMPVIMFIQTLYPDFELLTGREYSQSERGMKKRLATLLALFVVPLIVGILLELSKPLWAR